MRILVVGTGGVGSAFAATPDLRRLLRNRRHLSRHADDPLRAAPDQPVRACRRQARRLPVDRAADWEERGLLALVGIGIEPGAADVFARHAADELFSEIDEIGVRDGSNIAVEGYDFAPTFSTGRRSRSA